MRITKEIADYLKNKILEIHPESKVYLFGSRVDDQAKGGDIDILILSVNKLKFNEISKIRTGFFKKFGEQKIDLVNFTFDDQHPFKDLALNNAIEL
ncbi:MAG: nucleotidyltransferase domain-containing protein [Candidatus Caenarcaniphilales bacterium]|nr:nucleotidyltransferase domain-containing protein [Candidatus Caenarcaniphilales bacterium]